MAAQKVTARDLFETAECSRCLGSGRYSFNLLHGDRCYGCGGRGYKLTKNGAAAREAWVAAFTKPIRVDAVKPGERVVIADHRGRLVLTVSESGPDLLNPGRWHLAFEPGKGLGGYGFVSPADTVELPVSADEKRAAYETIAAMPGALGWPA